MSIRVMSAVWELDLPDSEKLVALALADWSDDNGKSWPSVGQIATKCSKSERTVQGTLKALEAKGWLRRDMVPGKGVIYHLDPRRDCTPADTAPPQGLRETPAATAPNTSKHTIPKKDKPSSGRRSKSIVDVPDWVPSDAWEGFVDMRKRERHPLTPRALELAIGKLKKLSDDGYPPGEVLDQSTLRGWRGLFKIEDHDNGRNGRTEARQHGPTPRVSAALEFVGVH